MSAEGPALDLVLAMVLVVVGGVAEPQQANEDASCRIQHAEMQLEVRATNPAIAYIRTRARAVHRLTLLA